ncbi:MAG: MarC family protein [Candidatus Bathyarchaeia archaeon]
MLQHDPIELAKAVIALFAVLDPIGNVPIFIGLTSDLSEEKRRSVFNATGITAFILLLAFTLLGQYILELFAISVDSFMVAGGILLLAISVRILLEGWRSPAKTKVGVVPLACPLLVGPGAITTSLILVRTVGFPVTLIAVVMNIAIVWATLRSIGRIYKLLGETGSEIIASITAIIVAAIAVEYIARGIRSLL